MKEKNKGFILIEIMVALVILATGIVFLVQALSNITQSNKRVRNNRIAYLLIDNIYNRFYSGEELHPGEILINNKQYFWGIEAQSKNEGLINLTVDVSWNESGAKHVARLEHAIINTQ